MKIKKLKKELSVSLANKKINFKNFFLFELKQSKKNFTSEKNILYSKTFVKLISKNVNGVIAFFNFLCCRLFIFIKI